MKVWLVTCGIAYEGEEILKIFSSRESAVAYKIMFDKSPERIHFDWIGVDEREVEE